MHKKVLQNAHFKNRFALQTDGEIGQSDRFETAPPNQKQGWNKIYYIYKYDLFPDERTNHFGNSRLALQFSALKKMTDALRNSRYLRPEIGETVLPAPPYPGNPVRPGPPTRTLPR